MYGRDGRPKHRGRGRQCDIGGTLSVRGKGGREKEGGCQTGTIREITRVIGPCRRRVGTIFSVTAVLTNHTKGGGGAHGWG